MNNLVKIGIVGAVAYGIYYAWTKFASTASQYANQVSFKITSIGIPKISSGNLTVPVIVTVQNPAPVPVPVSSVAVNASTQKLGAWLPVGSTQPKGFTLNPGANTVELLATVDLKKLNPLSSGADALSILNTVITGGSPSITIKVDVAIDIAGVLISQTEVKTLKLSDIKNLSGLPIASASNLLAA